MIVQLSQAYASRDRVPSIERVDDPIFQRTYFTDCMGCGFCHDACCSYGAEIDVENVQRLLAIADQLEPSVGQPRTLWFTNPALTCGSARHNVPKYHVGGKSLALTNCANRQDAVPRVSSAWCCGAPVMSNWCGLGLSPPPWPSTRKPRWDSLRR